MFIIIIQRAGANVLDCDIAVSEFELQLCNEVHFQTNTHWKRYRTPFILPGWVKKYHCYFSIMMALALNNPRRLIYH